MAQSLEDIATQSSREATSPFGTTRKHHLQTAQSLEDIATQSRRETKSPFDTTRKHHLHTAQSLEDIATQSWGPSMASKRSASLSQGLNHSCRARSPTRRKFYGEGDNYARILSPSSCTNTGNVLSQYAPARAHFATESDKGTTAFRWKSKSDVCLHTLTTGNHVSSDAKSIERDSGFQDASFGSHTSVISTDTDHDMPNSHAVQRSISLGCVEKTQTGNPTERNPSMINSPSIPSLAKFTLKASAPAPPSNGNSPDASPETSPLDQAHTHTLNQTNLHVATLKSWNSMALLTSDDIEAIQARCQLQRESLAHTSSLVTVQRSASDTVPPPVPKRLSSCMENCTIPDDYLLTQGRRMNNVSSASRKEEKGTLKTLQSAFTTLLKKTRKSPDRSQTTPSPTTSRRFLGFPDTPASMLQDSSFSSAYPTNKTFQVDACEFQYPIDPPSAPQTHSPEENLLSQSESWQTLQFQPYDAMLDSEDATASNPVYESTPKTPTVRVKHLHNGQLPVEEFDVAVPIKIPPRKKEYLTIVEDNSAPEDSSTKKPPKQPTLHGCEASPPVGDYKDARNCKLHVNRTQTPINGIEQHRSVHTGGAEPVSSYENRGIEASPKRATNLSGSTLHIYSTPLPSSLSVVGTQSNLPNEKIQPLSTGEIAVSAERLHTYSVPNVNTGPQPYYSQDVRGLSPQAASAMPGMPVELGREKTLPIPEIPGYSTLQIFNSHSSRLPSSPSGPPPPPPPTTKYPDPIPPRQHSFDVVVVHSTLPQPLKHNYEPLQHLSLNTDPPMADHEVEEVYDAITEIYDMVDSSTPTVEEAPNKSAGEYVEMCDGIGPGIEEIPLHLVPEPTRTTCSSVNRRGDLQSILSIRQKLAIYLGVEQQPPPNTASTMPQQQKPTCSQTFPLPTQQDTVVPPVTASSTLLTYPESSKSANSTKPLPIIPKKTKMLPSPPKQKDAVKLSSLGQTKTESISTRSLPFSHGSRSGEGRKEPKMSSSGKTSSGKAYHSWTTRVENPQDELRRKFKKRVDMLQAMGLVSADSVVTPAEDSLADSRESETSKESSPPSPLDVIKEGTVSAKVRAAEKQPILPPGESMSYKCHSSSYAHFSAPLAVKHKTCSGQTDTSAKQSSVTTKHKLVRKPLPSIPSKSVPSLPLPPSLNSRVKIPPPPTYPRAKPTQMQLPLAPTGSSKSIPPPPPPPPPPLPPITHTRQTDHVASPSEISSSADVEPKHLHTPLHSIPSKAVQPIPPKSVPSLPFPPSLNHTSQSRDEIPPPPTYPKAKPSQLQLSLAPTSSPKSIPPPPPPPLLPPTIGVTRTHQIDSFASFSETSSTDVESKRIHKAVKPSLPTISFNLTFQPQTSVSPLLPPTTFLATSKPSKVQPPTALQGGSKSISPPPPPPSPPMNLAPLPHVSSAKVSPALLPLKHSVSPKHPAAPSTAPKSTILSSPLPLQKTPEPVSTRPAQDALARKGQKTPLLPPAMPAASINPSVPSVQQPASESCSGAKPHPVVTPPPPPPKKSHITEMHPVEAGPHHKPSRGVLPPLHMVETKSNTVSGSPSTARHDHLLAQESLAK